VWSSDLRIAGIDPAHASALWSLLTLEGTRVRRLPMAFAILDKGRPVLLFAGKRHVAVPAGFDRITKDTVGALAAALGVRLLLAAEEEALRDIVEDVQTRWRHGGDQLVQAEVVIEQIRVGVDDGSIIVWPDFFTVALRLDAPTMRRFLDVVFPCDSSMILYTFQRQAIHSALILTRGSRDIETVAGHLSVRDRVGSFQPWQEGYRKILEAAEKVHAQPSLGFFGEMEAVREMLQEPRPGQLTKAILARRVIVDPMPPWMAATLGIDALTRAARISLDFIERADRLGLGRRFDLGSVTREVRSRIEKRIDFEQMLGFDPFDYLARFIAWWSGRT